MVVIVGAIVSASTAAADFDEATFLVGPLETGLIRRRSTHRFDPG
jgi:hypothetical protein